ncbi:MAG: hypothetical protein PHH40_01265 [Candidatus Moranbacteria bacterium]|nr:hypothetical protein [Candidatus Moranbacteria bacterium]MDD3964942.1 hypothetical protein [Candidatus Moranbacteria bacterium]
MVTAICNIFINSDFKLRLFKETFPRVYDVSDNWLVNIRGKYREDVIKYIQETFEDSGENCIFFSGLDNGDWARSTSKMLERSRYDYVYVFLEDHFLLKSLDHFKDVIRDMEDSDIDYFQYSFFNVGLHTNSIEKIYPDFTDFFCSFILEPKQLREIRKNHKYFFPYSLASVASKRYFLKLLELERKKIVKVPSILQEILGKIFLRHPKNRLLWFVLNKMITKIGFRLAIYSPATPFNLEKSLFDFDEELMSIKVGVLTEELFANWDDDNGVSDTSLMKRGLYPLSFVVNDVNYEPSILKKYNQSKERSLKFQYYADKSRITTVPLKYISVESGSLKIVSSLETVNLNAGEYVWVAANIPHMITAIEDCWYNVYIRD